VTPLTAVPGFVTTAAGWRSMKTIICLIDRHIDNQSMNCLDYAQCVFVLDGSWAAGTLGALQGSLLVMALKSQVLRVCMDYVD